MNGIIVIAPHPDDEIFALPYINYFKKLNTEITILFITSNSKRKNEAIKSSNFLKCKYLFASDLGYEFKDGYIHLNFVLLKDLIKKYTKNFKTVLSPILEGGHQDHDSIALATLYANYSNKKTEFVYYPTYTAINKSIFYSVMSQNKYCKNIFFLIKQKYMHMPFKSFYLMFIIYKSQSLSWLFLVVPYLITICRIRNANYYKLSICEKLIEEKINSNISLKPLYEIHKRCSQKEWMKSVSLI